MPKKQKTYAIGGLLTGALVWGLIWHPFRLLEGKGFHGSLGAAYVYVVALVITACVYWREIPKIRGAGHGLLWIGIVSGWTNLAYVVATIQGEVMRVLLLFYLAPLWTLFFARFFLREILRTTGLLVVAISLGGAVVMLWNPSQGLPVPANGAEWLGLSAGMAFALSNVLIRKADRLSIPIKSIAVFAGVSLISFLWSGIFSAPRSAPVLDGSTIAMVVAIGVVIMLTNFAVQYGLTHISANQAIVILLFELVVAAFGSYFLAGEVMSAQEWAGGAMIVTASLLSGRLESPQEPVLEAEGNPAKSTRG